MTAKTTFHVTVKCQCGCGLPAPVASASDRSRGRIAGQPHRFRRGHQAKTRSRAPLGQRFWPRVDRRGDDDCWPWLGYVRKDSPYGLFNIRAGESMHAHRFAYLDLVGPIPSGLDLDHLCRNTTCVNPKHLEPVTRSENLRRAAAARANQKNYQE